MGGVGDIIYLLAFAVGWKGWLLVACGALAAAGGCECTTISSTQHPTNRSGETMPIAVNDMKTLQVYVRGVTGKAIHHAKNVDKIVLAIAGAVILRKDNSPLQVRQGAKGALGRALQFTTQKGKTYALSYNHTSKEIDLKKDNYQGKVIHSFSNATTLVELSKTFAKL
jgi:hypothetical protein